MIKQLSPDISIIEVKDTKEGLEKVTKGEVYAFIGSMPTIAYTKQKYNFHDVIINGKIDNELLAKIAK